MERVNGLLRQVISDMLASELKDPRLSSLISVTRVETTADLSTARVYVSVLGDQAAKRSTLSVLRSAAGFVRKGMRRQVSFKRVPSIDFHIDESIEQGEEVLKLIKEVAPGPEVSGTL
jgi:ribosome-binding factor A